MRSNAGTLLISYRRTPAGTPRVWHLSEKLGTSSTLGRRPAPNESWRPKIEKCGSPKEVRHPPRSPPTPEGEKEINLNRWPQRELPESLIRGFRFHPLIPERFHVLLNSLFKVLFNFPSRYLFAIGLVGVFSLRWSLPPTWGCTFKQPDSEERSIRELRRSHGPGTLSGPWLHSRET